MPDGHVTWRRYGKRRNVSPTLGSGTAIVRERNRYGLWRVQLLLSALGVVGFSEEMGFACLFGGVSDRTLSAAEGVYMRGIRP